MRWTALVLAALGWSVRVEAQPSDADKAAAEQKEAHAQQIADGGDLEGAAAEFRAAYKLDPSRPELLCDVGIAYFKAQQLPRAQLVLNQCLARGTALEAGFVTGVRQVLTGIEATLGQGDFTPLNIVFTPEGATVTVDSLGDADSFVDSRIVYVPFGAHQITFHREGYVDHVETVTATGRTVMPVSVTLARPTTGVTPGKPVRIAPPEARRSRVAPLVASIATGVVGVAAIAAYLHARSIASAAGGDQLTYDDYVSHRHSARTWQHLSWVAGGIAGAGAVVSGYLWYRATRSQTTLEVRPAADGASVSIGATF